MLVYLSGPIAPRDGFTVEDNIKSALAAFLVCFKQGIPCFVPHLLPQIEEISYDEWMEYDLEMLKHCTHMAMLPRWGNSVGALIEKSEALKMHLPIYESVEELVKVYGETTRTDSARTRKGTKKETSVGKERGDERPQNSNSEGAQSTKAGTFTGVFLDQS